MTRLDADVVRVALTARAVIDAYGIAGRVSGDQWRTRLCPVCGPRSRDSVAIDLASGRWIDHAHGCRGDLLALVAGLEGLDAGRDFARVLARAAEIAGVVAEADDPDRERRLEERRRAEVERVRQAEADKAAARARMPAAWSALDRRSLVGERYLQGRGLDPSPLRARGLDLVRYNASGDPAIAARDLATGEIVGVQYRHIHGAARLMCETGSELASTCFAGRLAELDPDGVDVAVLCEGLADTIAASLAWPTCAVFGAPGQAQLETIAAAVAPRVREVGGWLLLVVDDDEIGIKAGAAAMLVAQEAGLVRGRDLIIVELGDHHDLADAWRAGWRWEWPGYSAGGRP